MGAPARLCTPGSDGHWGQSERPRNAGICGAAGGDGQQRARAQNARLAADADQRPRRGCRRYRELRLRGAMTRKGYLLALCLVAAAPAVRGEYIVLRNGQRLHVTGYERAGATGRLAVPGGRIEVAAGDVVTVEPEDSFPASPALTLSVPYAELIRAAAQKHGVNQELIASVIAVESNFNPRAVSPKLARGLMQLLPE